MEEYKADIIRELELEHNRCQAYFDLMYRTLQFVFVAIVALAVCAFTNDADPELKNLILCLLLPICIYVFGIMYTYNAYALTVCGKRAEMLHSEAFAYIAKWQSERGKNSISISVLSKYVVTDRKITLIAYGVPLGFYLVMPAASYYVGNKYYAGYPDTFLKTCPIICLILYYALMGIILWAIAKDFFLKQIQNRLTEAPPSDKGGKA